MSPPPCSVCLGRGMVEHRSATMWCCEPCPACTTTENRAARVTVIHEFMSRVARVMSPGPTAVSIVAKQSVALRRAISAADDLRTVAGSDTTRILAAQLNNELAAAVLSLDAVSAACEGPSIDGREVEDALGDLREAFANMAALADALGAP